MNLHTLFDPARFAAAFGAVDALDPSMIERCRGRTPNLAITAPVHGLLRRDHTDEDLRLAQFEQSRMTRDGVVAPFGSPSDTGTQYASEARVKRTPK